MDDDLSHETIEALGEWAGLRIDEGRPEALARILPGTRERARRLYAVETEDHEFDFLAPLR